MTTAGVAAGRALRGRYGSVTEGVELPEPVKTVPVPPSQPFTVPGLSPYVTPNADFYRIDTALFVPQVERGRLERGRSRDGRPPVRAHLRRAPRDADGRGARHARRASRTRSAATSSATPVWQGVPLPTLLDASRRAARRRRRSSAARSTASPPASRRQLRARRAHRAGRRRDERRAAPGRARLPGATGRRRASTATCRRRSGCARSS